MIIYLAFLQASEIHPIPAYSFWEYYIKNGIEEAGHQWIETAQVDWAEGLVPMNKQQLDDWKSRTWDFTLKDLQNRRADLFLSYLYPHQIETAAIKQIQTLGIPCVNFYCDHIREFSQVPKEYFLFDLNWVPEFAATNFYKQKKLPYLNLPMPMWISPKERDSALKENDRTSFIGSIDIQRLFLFEALSDADIDFDVYGVGWFGEETISTPILDTSIGKKLSNQFEFIRKFGSIAYLRKLARIGQHKTISEKLSAKLKGKISFETYNSVTKNSQITIGVNRFPSFRFPFHKPGKYSRLRDIEAPMLGACYLTEYVEGLEQFYDINEEIFTYNSIPELIQQIEFLKSNPILRNRARISAQQRALSQHSIPNSLTSIINFLGVK